MNAGEQREGAAAVERILVVLLRFSGIVLMTALVPAVMPFAWMDAIHRWLGLGELPQLPITEYLTRSLSAMYALHGVIVFYVAVDVHRYLPVIRLLAILGIVFAAGMLILDISAGMPVYWILSEGPLVALLGGILLALANRVQRDETAGE